MCVRILRLPCSGPIQCGLVGSFGWTIKHSPALSGSTVLNGPLSNKVKGQVLLEIAEWEPVVIDRVYLTNLVYLTSMDDGAVAVWFARQTFAWSEPPLQLQPWNAGRVSVRKSLNHRRFIHGSGFRGPPSGPLTTRGEARSESRFRDNGCPKVSWTFFSRRGYLASTYCTVRMSSVQ